MNIEVGEWVRTKDGIIAKLIDYEEDLDTYYFDKVIYLDYIVNHSKNIIDLIEAGDFVNGKFCINIEENYTDTGRRNLKLICIGGNILELSNTIQTILTREQYERNSYRLEG